MACRDFIFYSQGGLCVRRTLTVPPISQLMTSECTDPRPVLTVPDLYWSSYDRRYRTYPLM